MSRMEIIVMSALLKLEATTPLSSVTIMELKKDFNMNQSTATLRRTLIKLMVANYVLSGLKDSKSYTYFISNTGINFLKEVNVND